MKISTDEAWRKAANCAVLMQQAPDHATRLALVRMRDSWIAIANDGAFLGAFDGYAALASFPVEPPRRAVPHTGLPPHSANRRIRQNGT